LVAQAADQLDVALRVEPGLALYGEDAFGDRLLRLLDAPVDRHDAERMGDFDTVAEVAAQQLADRPAQRLAGDVVDRDIERRLGVGVALHHTVHAGVDVGDLKRGNVLYGGEQVCGD